MANGDQFKIPVPVTCNKVARQMIDLNVVLWIIAFLSKIYSNQTYILQIIPL